jgi:hypothetical protein
MKEMMKEMMKKTKKENTKTATCPYWADQVAQPIAMNFVPSPDAKMLITCVKFGFDR